VTVTIHNIWEVQCDDNSTVLATLAAIDYYAGCLPGW